MRFDVATDFAGTVGGRYRRLSRFSGEDLKDRLLQRFDALAAGETLDVWLDGTTGYGSGFLAEAFGGLAVARPGTDIRNRVRILAASAVFENYAVEARAYLAGS